MTYATLMVHLQPGRSNAAVLAMTHRLAVRHEAAVIGMVATQPIQIQMGDGAMSADLYRLDAEEMAVEISKAEAEFRQALTADVAKLEWRSASLMTSLAERIACEARSADLLISAVDESGYCDNMRRVVTSDLVMQAGRPVLLVPALAHGARTDRVMVAWKDTREARRAVVDALPLLRSATQVSLVEVRGNTEPERSASVLRLDELAVWLKRHGITADCRSEHATSSDAAVLATLGEELQIDLTVAGAYGHSRLREWALGGVTRDLLVSGRRCSLLSC
ncbi:MAG: universal stress protein [Comamonadaceae bacterium]|nr:MAG: universal stress protein [Comamonadaceae bacterium]